MTKNEYTCDCTIIHENVLNDVRGKMLEAQDFDKITKFFKTLGDSTRIRIMWALYNNEMCVCDLANLLSMTKSAISHQLRELRLAKLVSSRKVGKTVYYVITDDHVTSSIKNAMEHIKE